MRLVLRAIALIFAVAIPAAAQVSAVPIQTTPLDPANLDRSVSACTDFYQFANGGWIKRNPIPPRFRAGAASISSRRPTTATFSRFSGAPRHGNAQAEMPTCVSSVPTTPSCMDSVGAERAGATPLTARAQTHRGDRQPGPAGDRDRPIALAGPCQCYFVSAPRRTKKNSTSVIAGVSQGLVSRSPTAIII